MNEESVRANDDIQILEYHSGSPDFDGMWTHFLRQVLA